MHIEHVSPGSEHGTALAQIARLAKWAQYANAYVDEHAAPPPQSGDRAAREELAMAMEDLSDLLQRYGDALRGFEDREPSAGDAPAQLPEANGRHGTLLRFPSRGNAATPPRGSAGGRRRPVA